MRVLFAILLSVAIGLWNAPAFWWLIGAEFAAAPSVRIDADGRRTPTLTGPLAPWPEWADVPTAKSITPRYGEPLHGNGIAAFDTSIETAWPGVKAGLRDRGWQVVVWRQLVVIDGPVPYSLCVLRASRPDAPDRNLIVAFRLGSGERNVPVVWYRTAVPQPLPAADQC